MRRLLWAALLCLAIGCASSDGPPPITQEMECVHCGMATTDLRVACEARGAGGEWRVYDSIECLIAHGDASDPQTAYLADYDTRGLHRADSLWVVHGSFATPMGGGYAAFLSRVDAVALARETAGTVDRLAAFAAEPSPTEPSRSESRR
jgi:hypothetical protein